MTGLFPLVKRNTKLFFKDRGMFFPTLITPMILLVLYVTFLARVYRDSFVSALPAGITIPEGVIDATVGGQLISSLLAVACVTVAFCSNLLMINDKVSGAIRDLTVTPLKRSTLALSYFLSSALSTLIITFSALAVCLFYLSVIGFYMSLGDVFLILLDVLLLTLFGIALSSCINFFLSTNGQASAVGTIVSAGYGFVCGAYMPISQFSTGLQKVLSFLPGTYGTSLLRNHALAGVYREMEKTFPSEVIDAIRDSVDCNIYFFDTKVSIGTMYAILALSTLLFVGIYVLSNVFCKKKRT